MASLYILQSVDKKTFYIGSCVDLTLRLGQHRNKAYKNSFTSKGNWEVFLSINDLSYNQAGKTEVHIKRMKSRKYIINLKQFPEMTEKLIALYADS
jgi:putative endonuclease